MSKLAHFSGRRPDIAETNQPSRCLHHENRAKNQVKKLRPIHGNGGYPFIQRDVIKKDVHATGIGGVIFMANTQLRMAAFRALALGAGAVGAVALGALAVASAAVGALAIGALTIRKLRLLETARLKEIHIDRLIISELEIRSTTPKTE